MKLSLKKNRYLEEILKKKKNINSFLSRLEYGTSALYFDRGYFVPGMIDFFQK